MNPSDELTPASSSCGVAEERLEAYTAGDLPACDRDAIEAHLADCGDCAEVVRLAVTAKHALSQLPELRCPTRLVDAAETAAAVYPASARRFVGASKRDVALLAVAASFAAVWFAASSTPRPSEPAITTGLDAEEVKLALVELRATFHSRAEAVKQKVYDRSLAKPVRQVVFAMTDNKLADWGAKAANLLGRSEPIPPDAS